MHHDKKLVIPPLAETLVRLGITDVGRVVPRQVTMELVGQPGVIIIATAMGVEYDGVEGAIRIAITGGMHKSKPLKYLKLKGFDGESLVWDSRFHDPEESPLMVKLTFGPTIGLAQ